MYGVWSREYTYRHRSIYTYTHLHPYIHPYTRLVMWAARCALAVPSLCCFSPFSVAPLLRALFPYFAKTIDILLYSYPPLQLLTQHMNLISTYSYIILSHIIIIFGIDWCMHPPVQRITDTS